MLFKSLDENNRSPYANFDFTPYLSENGKPGKWLPEVINLQLCASGYHGCKDGDILEYLTANIYEIETRGKVKDGDDKFTAQQIRLVRKCEGWNDTSARLFACDCAAHVLKFFEEKCPDDKRPRECIETARRFAHGKATSEELDAAWSAAGRAAWSAAWSAARSAARSAGWSAVGSAVGSAAWSAARSAAWSAAWSAARSAAWSTVGSAAESAAERAEHKWQTRRLLKLLK